MKWKTKRSIIRWVEKLLNFSFYEVIRHQHIYNNQELQMISEHQVRFAAGLSIIEILNNEDMGKSFISYSKEVYDGNHTKVTAELKVIRP